MSTYNKILVAVDVSNEAEIVLSRAIDMADKFDAKIILAHVIEPILSETDYGLTPSFNIDIEDALTKRAHDFLDQLITKFNLNDARSLLTVGGTKQEIHRICKEEEIDLIVIGTHGRHGFSLLLGSTANAVLHGTECDVLSVKICTDS